MNTILVIVAIIVAMVIVFCVGSLYELGNAQKLNNRWYEFSTKQIEEVSTAYEKEIEKLQAELKKLRGEG